MAGGKPVAETGDAELAKGLSGRHIEFIAIGGAIGAGLFLGSGQGIQLGGPSVILSYLLCGAIVYLMTRALGELTLNQPVAPSFVPHIERHVGAWAGFVTGWSYWLLWVLVGILEITAVAMLVRFWWPDFPQWISAGVTILTLFLLNRTAVKLFGELEFWLTLIKVVTIIALIIGGLAMTVLHLGPPGQEANVANLWSHGGFFPNGFKGFAATLVIAFFAFGSAELIGVTAGEAKDPQRSVPRAINAVILRILIFYVGSLTVIMMVAPWDTFDGQRSPYVMVFELVGLGGAAALINFVVITAVISSCNSGIFATGRLLLSLANQGDAPAYFRKIDGRKLPARAITASAVAMAFGVLLNYLVPEKAFGYLLSVIAALMLWTWTMIVVAHLRFRSKQTAEEVKTNAFRMPLFPITNWIALVGFGFVVVLMALDPASRITFYAAAAWFVLALVAFYLTRGRKIAR